LKAKIPSDTISPEFPLKRRRPAAENFCIDICGCYGDWTPGSFVESSIAGLKETNGSDKVI